MTKTVQNITIVSRRSFIKTGASAAAALAVLGSWTDEALASNGWEARLDALTGGAETADAGISLTMPEVAEDGSTVPFTVSVDSAMTDDDYVAEISMVSTANHQSNVTTFFMSPANGKGEITAKMRLGSTQDVLAIAKMSNGDVRMTKTNVRVTVGGCTG